jgi:hypothetical protein
MFEVRWNYKSSLGGPWKKGDVVQVDPPLAEAINRDSPGVLKEIKESPPKGKGKGKQDRMVKEAEQVKLKGIGETEEETESNTIDEGPITKANFKAVKD